MIAEKYYNEYAYLKDCIYLDVASVAMQPARTLKHCRRFQDTFVERRGRESLNGGFSNQRGHVISLLAKLVHCEEEEILLINNTSEGNSLLVNSLELTPGDNVISASIEHPAVILGWAEKQRQGVELRLVPTENGCFDEDKLLSMIDSKTKVVALSLVNYNTGFMPDMKKIGSVCREKGVILAVDGIQGLGRHPVDVKEMNIDYLSCAGYKGLLGVFGAGFLYCRKELQPLLKPRYYTEESIEFSAEAAAKLSKMPAYPYKEGLQKLEGGAKSTYTVSSLGVSVAMLLDIGISEIEEKLRTMEKIFRGEVAERTDRLQFLGSMKENHWSGNICMLFDQNKYDAVRSAFERHHIIARVRPGDIRLAMHYYNTPEQMRKVAQVLCEALE